MSTAIIGIGLIKLTANVTSTHLGTVFPLIGSTADCWPMKKVSVTIPIY